MCLSGWSAVEAFREWLVRSNPRERSKKERCWLAFLQRCGAESWTEVKCCFSMHCVLFPQCVFVWPAGSNKTLEEALSSCSTNDFASQFYLCPPLSCKTIKSRSGLSFRPLLDRRAAPSRNYYKNHKWQFANTVNFNKFGHCLLALLNCYTVITIWCLTLMSNRKSSLTRYPPHIYSLVTIIIAPVLQKTPACMPMHGIAWAPIKNLQSQGLVSAFYTDWHTVKRKETKLEQG